MSRHPWYLIGADAAGRVWSGGGLPYGYPCPLCGRVFEPRRAELLTAEHVPAESLGGRRMCLTCWGCNNHASRQDKHARQREDNFEFAAGTMKSTRAITATAEIGSAKANVWIKSVGGPGGAIEILHSASHNPPGTGEALEGELRRLAAEGAPAIKLNLRGAAYNPREASGALLRYAYLTAFSLFGYSWAWSPACAVVRDRILSPDSEPQLFGVILDDQPETRRVWIVREPEELQSLIVQIGREAVFLPVAREDLEFYQRFASRRTSDTFQANMRGLEVDWPKEPMHLEDLGQVSLRALVAGGTP